MDMPPPVGLQAIMAVSRYAPVCTNRPLIVLQASRTDAWAITVQACATRLSPTAHTFAHPHEGSGCQALGPAAGRTVFGRGLLYTGSSSPLAVAAVRCELSTGFVNGTEAVDVHPSAGRQARRAKTCLRDQSPRLQLAHSLLGMLEDSAASPTSRTFKTPIFSLIENHEAEF